MDDLTWKLKFGEILINRNITVVATNGKKPIREYWKNLTPLDCQSNFETDIRSDPTRKIGINNDGALTPDILAYIGRYCSDVSEKHLMNTVEKFCEDIKSQLNNSTLVNIKDVLGEYISCKELYDRYKLWCRKNNEDPINSTNFYIEFGIQSKYHSIRRKYKGKKTTVYEVSKLAFK